MRKPFLLVAALCASLALAQDAVVLKRNPKEGETAKYTLKVDTEIAGFGKIKFSAKVVEKVMKVNADGTYSVSSEQQDVVVNIEGQEPTTSDVQPPVTTTYRPDGTVSELQGDKADSDAYRMSNIQVVVWPKDPVKVGSKWESDIAADKAKDTRDVHTTYEILANEKVGAHDCFKVAFDAVEKSGSAPAQSKGTLWIDIATGQVCKGDLQWINAPIANFSITGKVTLELSE